MFIPSPLGDCGLGYMTVSDKLKEILFNSKAKVVEYTPDIYFLMLGNSDWEYRDWAIEYDKDSAIRKILDGAPKTTPTQKKANESLINSFNRGDLEVKYVAVPVEKMLSAISQYVEVEKKGAKP